MSAAGEPAPAEHVCFVGDLSWEVTDELLQNAFGAQYPSVVSSKVMMDPVTGRSRGFGFVRFSDEEERDRAIAEMHGVYVGSKAVRCSLATPRPNPPSSASRSTAADGNSAAPSGELDPQNTTLFIGGLAASVTEADLHAAFAPFGDIVYVKVPAGKGCGFVQYHLRWVAERALEQMHGCVMGGQAIRVSWGRSGRPPPGVHAPALAGVGVVGGPQQPAGQASSIYGTFASPYAVPAGALAYGGHPYGAAGAYVYAAPPAASGGYDAAGAYGTYLAIPAGVSPVFRPQGYGFGPSASATLASATYDPLAPLSSEERAAFLQQRQLPALAAGHFVRVPVPVPHM